eukprot:g4499.t1
MFYSLCLLMGASMRAPLLALAMSGHTHISNDFLASLPTCLSQRSDLLVRKDMKTWQKQPVPALCPVRVSAAQALYLKRVEDSFTVAAGTCAV